MSVPVPAQEWQRGLLPTCALAILAQGSAHGYAVAQQLQKLGIGPVKGGALYPVLNRLETDGAVISIWREGEGGPGRKVFEITAAGHERLEQMQCHWKSFSNAVAGLLGTASDITASEIKSPDRAVPDHFQ